MEDIILEEIEKHVETEINQAAKWKARYEGKIEAYGSVLNKIRQIKKKQEEDKRKHDDFVDAIRYAFHEQGERSDS